MTTTAGFLLAGGAALVAGTVNAIAGGGSLITFPALVAAGLPPVIANVTNTVAMCPGYFGAFFAQRRDLVGQRPRLVMIFPTGLIGGLLGGLLLLHTGASTFKLIVPYLILFAAALLVLQERLRAWMVPREQEAHSEAWAIIPIALTAVYGGYFGAGMGVMALAALSIVLNESFTRLNALKQGIALSSNFAAAALFACSGEVDWQLAGVMFVAALAGGALGGVFASKIPPGVLRWTVVALAIVVGVIYLIK